jgi:hypothetical protein
MTQVTQVKLIEDEIDGVEFEIVIAPHCKVAKLYINGVDWFISDVDLAQIIRAVINSDDIYEVIDAVKGVWRDDDLITIIRSMI